MGSFQTYMLVTARVGGMLLGLPMFSARFLPQMWRVGLCLLLAAVLLPVTQEVAELSESQLLPAMVWELLAGVMVGLGLVMVFAAMQVAGQLMDVQMGFGIANVVDPLWDQSVPLVGNFLNLFAILVFMMSDGHHHLIRGLQWSFTALPAGTPVISGAAVGGLVELFGWMLVTAVRLSAPVVGVLLTVNLALGVLGRTMPQMNILVVGMPIKILAGLLMLLAVVPFLAPALGRLFDHIFRLMPGMWEVMVP